MATATQQPPPIEPGVLPVLRAVVMAIWLLYTPFLLLLGRANPNSPGTTSLILNWGFTTAMLIYLWLRPLARHVPKTHIAIGLVALAVAPILSDTLVNGLHLAPGRPLEGELMSGTTLYFWLIAPALLIGVQFGRNPMLLLIVATSLLSYVLAEFARFAWGFDDPRPVTHAIVRMILYVVIGLIVLGIVASQRRLQAALAQKNEQIAAYALRMEELAVTQERNRLARELHDTLAHSLSAVEVQLKVIAALLEADPAAARQQVAETQTLAREGLREARRALHDLRASPIEEFGLMLALRRLCERAAERGGLEAQIALPQQVPCLSSAQQQQLYRIAEEALNNVVRHARARRFTLALSQRGPALSLRIHDDGVGFDAAAVPETRFGVRGMAERAALINAALTVTSAPGAGTNLDLLVKGDCP